MGAYLNPGNNGFTSIIKTDYVDKTGLIGIINSRIDTKANLICISRPRRFGKSYAAQMLCAYYDKTCESDELFAGYEIARSEDYKEHLNKYDVIYVDMTGIKPYSNHYKDVDEYVSSRVTKELRSEYPDMETGEDFSVTLVNATKHTGNKFIMIIDEWDAPIRENPEIERDYLEFLRSLFKSSGTTATVFAAVYMTGILPIKKDGSQSAISDFKEYTMIKPRIFAQYVGFTEEEVRQLCEKHDVDFDTMKAWYDGYTLKDVGSVYNPNSVMCAIEDEEFDSYWTETSAAESLMGYISRDYKGLAKTVAELIGGVEVEVNTRGFANDLITFRSRDDVLTLLIHLGYLAYDAERRTVRIPNEEIKQEFQQSVRNVDSSETVRRLQESDELFLATINMDEEAVAAQIEKIHTEETAPLHYNREDSLRSVIKLAYYTYRDHYVQWEELPGGSGYADVVYIPKYGSEWPALVIEMKWNQDADGAIDQILRKKYPDPVKGLGCDILLVGISYDKEAPAGERRHRCRIVRV